ncbi:MAG: hypothetical protein HOV68_16845 [Streptomycetaceae bacterium]|nr:hypothetical protein [Streptomycetaceae bacterium]
MPAPWSLPLTASAWVIGAVVAVIIVAALLILVIVRTVVRKSRAEDLPEVLVGLADVLHAAAGILPWRRDGKRREDANTAPTPDNTAPAAESGPAAPPAATTVVIVDAHGTAAPPASVPPRRSLPTAPQTPTGGQP